jgi:hypothetical protein
MRRILRITNHQTLSSPNPGDYTSRLSQATHAYFYFAEYIIHDDGTWEEGRSWAAAVSVEELHNLLDDAGLFRELTAPKQSGGD